MRRLLDATVAAVLLAGFVVSGAPAASAGGVGRLVISSNAADLEWDTCLEPQPGDVCRHTQIIAEETYVHETNAGEDPAVRGELIRWGGPAVRLRIWDYALDAETGDYVMIRESFGGIGVPGIPGTRTNPTVQIDTRLRAADAEATDVRMDVHLPDGSTERAYAAVSVRATGTGPLQPMRLGYMTWDRQRRTTERQEGWSRTAQATARVDGAPVPGTLVSARLTHSTYTNVLVLKGRVVPTLLELGEGEPAASALPMQRWTTASGYAGWSTCAEAALGEVCREVFVAYDDTADARGQRSTTASLQSWDLRLVAELDGERFFDNVRSLVVYDAPASVVAPQTLTGAAVAVDGAEGWACTYPAEGEETCAPQATSFSATFTGTGETQRFSSSYVTWNGPDRQVMHLTGTARAASAEGAVDGVANPGASYDGSVSSARGQLHSR